MKTFFVTWTSDSKLRGHAIKARNRAEAYLKLSLWLGHPVLSTSVALLREETLMYEVHPLDSKHICQCHSYK